MAEKRGEATQLFSPDDDLKMQGFFVYRGKRLISYGGWLGLKNLDTSPEYKLVRIRVDFQNTSDNEWSLDIRKSMARPPRKIRAWLIRNANLARNRSKVAIINKNEDSQQNQKSNSFWKKSYGQAPSLNWNDTFLMLLLQSCEDGKLTSELLKGYLESFLLASTTAVAFGNSSGTS